MIIQTILFIIKKKNNMLQDLYNIISYNMKNLKY